MRRVPRGITVAPGARVGRGVRWERWPGAAVRLGPDSCLGDDCRVRAFGGAIVLHRGAIVGAGSWLTAHAGIEIGPGARLGDGVALFDFDHVHADPDLPIRVQGLDAAPIVIGAGAVLGPGAAVLRGIHVGEGAVVGAHAVVTHDVPAGARVVGVPARAPDDPRPAPGTELVRGRPGGKRRKRPAAS